MTERSADKLAAMAELLAVSEADVLNMLLDDSDSFRNRTALSTKREVEKKAKDGGGAK